MLSKTYDIKLSFNIQNSGQLDNIPHNCMLMWSFRTTVYRWSRF